MKDDPLDPAFALLLKQFMEEQIPFNKYLGMKVVAVERGYVHCELPFRDELVGDPVRPAIHGGVISTLADAVGGCAVFSIIEPGAKCSTIDLRVDYLRPGRLETLHAKARVLRKGGRVVVAKIDVYQDDPEAPIAVAMAVYAVRKG
jgi:uncharacterized protein (TIGR00369 family)